MTDYNPKDDLKEFFRILAIVETNDDGDKEFHPVFISSCRVGLTEKMNKLLKRLEDFANT